MASGWPETHLWEYGLSLPERRKTRGVKGSVREAFPRRRCDRSPDGAILRHLRGAERQVWSPMDVSRSRERLVGNRLPVLKADDEPLFVVHRSTMDRFI